VRKITFLFILALLVLTVILKSGYSQQKYDIPIDKIKFWLSTSEKYKDGYYKVHASYMEKEAVLNFQSKGRDRVLCRETFFNKENGEMYGEYWGREGSTLFTKYYLIMKGNTEGIILKPDFPNDAHAELYPRGIDPAGVMPDTIVIFIPDIIKEGGKEGLRVN